MRTMSTTTSSSTSNRKSIIEESSPKRRRTLIKKNKPRSIITSSIHTIQSKKQQSSKKKECDIFQHEQELSILNVPYMQALERITATNEISSSLNSTTPSTTTHHHHHHARMVAQMLRNHAQLCLKHAATIERVALFLHGTESSSSTTSATIVSLWDTYHQQAMPLEELQQHIQEEAIFYLAKISFQTMTCMKRRFQRLKALMESHVVIHKEMRERDE